MNAENNILFKESGIAWLGQIPKHWKAVKGKNIFKEEKRNAESQSEIVTCFRDGIVTLRKNRRIEGFTNSLKEIGYQGIKVGDLVIHGMDAFAGAIGVSDSDGKSTPVYIVCNPIQPTMAINRYYAYYLRNLANGGFILSLAKGIRERSTDFRFSELKEILFPLPPLREQKAIADFLDQKCKQIENFLAKKEKLISLLQEKKQSLIHESVTQGLHQNIPFKESGIAWLGQIPEHWGVVKLKSVVSLRNQKDFGNDFKIGLENIESKTGKYIQINEVVFEEGGIRFFEGDVLFGKLRPYLAKVFLANRSGICVSEFLVLKGEKIYNKFLKFLMLSGSFISVVDGSTCGTKMPRANWGFIGNLKVPIPPIEEQKAIADFLDQKCEQIDHTIEKIKSQIELMKEYKSSLINEAVCGRIKLKEKK